MQLFPVQSVAFKLALRVSAELLEGLTLAVEEGYDSKRTSELAGSHRPPSPERIPFTSATSTTQKQCFPCLKKQSLIPTALINTYSNLWIYTWLLLSGLENNSLRCLSMPPAFLFICFVSRPFLRGYHECKPDQACVILHEFGEQEVQGNYIFYSQSLSRVEVRCHPSANVASIMAARVAQCACWGPYHIREPPEHSRGRGGQSLSLIIKSDPLSAGKPC